MSIEESPNCIKDKLTIFNGKDKDSVSVAKYCGSQSPFTMLNSIGSITINFLSDGVVNKNGFSLQYRGLTERPQGNIKWSYHSIVDTFIHRCVRL